MSKDNPFESFFTNDFTKFAPLPANVPFDMQSMMEAQRKNIQALPEAQQCAFEGLQAAAQKQTEIFSELFENNSKLAKEIMAEGTPEEKVAKQADMFKKCYEQSVSKAQKMAEEMGACNQQASEIINKRIAASLNEVKSAMQKAKTAERAQAKKASGKKAA
jgi:phasin family protein